MAEWTMEDVAARFSDAAETGRRLPRVRVQGYFNVWPAFAREVWESCPDDEHVYRPLPPTPQAIDRMMETMRWVQWLEVEQRHLVWMRAKHIRVESHLSSLRLRPHDGVATVADRHCRSLPNA